MCSFKQFARTFTFILLAAACSSKQAQEDGDGSIDTGDTRRAFDTRLPDAKEAPTERALGLDAVDSSGSRDAGSDSVDARDARDAADLRGPDAVEEGNRVVDAPDAADGRDSADSRDGRLDGTFDAPTDTFLDGSSDMAKDAPKDTSKDLPKEVAKMDRPAPVGPHGCNSPIVIPADSPAHVDLALTTKGADHWSDLSCGDGGPQVVVAVTVTQHEFIYADTFGGTWNTMLALSTTCPMGAGSVSRVAGMIACSDDACNTIQSQVVGELSGGTYYIIVGGANGESGDVTLHVQRAQAGNGPLAMLPAGMGSVTGATIDDVGAVDLCEGPANDNSYWWLTCPDDAGGDFVASTCDGTAFDSILGLQIPRTELVSCNDDWEPCGSRSQVSSTISPGAGLNVLSIDGATPRSFGAYQITYTRP